MIKTIVFCDACQANLGENKFIPAFFKATISVPVDVGVRVNHFCFCDWACLAAYAKERAE